MFLGHVIKQYCVRKLDLIFVSANELPKKKMNKAVCFPKNQNGIRLPNFFMGHVVKHTHNGKMCKFTRKCTYLSR